MLTDSAEGDEAYFQSASTHQYLFLQPCLHGFVTLLDFSSSVGWKPGDRSDTFLVLAARAATDWQPTMESVYSVQEVYLVLYSAFTSNRTKFLCIACVF